MNIEDIKKELESQFQSHEPKFNNKPCKNGCNCIEIAEYRNGGEPVKNYECLGDKVKLTDNNFSDLEKAILLKELLK